jgi:hypothetical protein
MVQEMKEYDHVTGEEVLIREHSAFSRAKKVINGPLFVPSDPSNPRTIAPIVNTLTGAAANLAMEQNKAYRLIGSVDFHYVLSDGTVAATVNEIYVPAKQPVIISSGILWKNISVIKATGASDGIVQIVEVK